MATKKRTDKEERRRIDAVTKKILQDAGVSTDNGIFRRKVAVPATWGTPAMQMSGAINQVPKIESNLGTELAIGAAGLLGPIGGGAAAEMAAYGPLYANAAKTLAVDLPAFEVIDRMPTLWGKERMTQEVAKGTTSGLTSLFRANPRFDRYGVDSGASAAKALGAAAGFAAGIPIGGVSHIMAGNAGNVLNATADAADRIMQDNAVRRATGEALPIEDVYGYGRGVVPELVQEAAESDAVPFYQAYREAIGAPARLQNPWVGYRSPSHMYAEPTYRYIDSLTPDMMDAANLGLNPGDPGYIDFALNRRNAGINMRRTARQYADEYIARLNEARWPRDVAAANRGRNRMYEEFMNFNLPETSRNYRPTIELGYGATDDGAAYVARENALNRTNRRVGALRSNNRSRARREVDSLEGQIEALRQEYRNNPSQDLWDELGNLNGVLDEAQQRLAAAENGLSVSRRPLTRSEAPQVSRATRRPRQGTQALASDATQQADSIIQGITPEIEQEFSDAYGIGIGDAAQMLRRTGNNPTSASDIRQTFRNLETEAGSRDNLRRMLQNGRLPSEEADFLNSNIPQSTDFSSTADIVNSLRSSPPMAGEYRRRLRGYLNDSLRSDILSGNEIDPRIDKYLVLDTTRDLYNRGLINDTNPSYRLLEEEAKKEARDNVVSGNIQRAVRNITGGRHGEDLSEDAIAELIGKYGSMPAVSAEEFNASIDAYANELGLDGYAKDVFARRMKRLEDRRRDVNKVYDMLLHPESIPEGERAEFNRIVNSAYRPSSYGNFSSPYGELVDREITDRMNQLYPGALPEGARFSSLLKPGTEEYINAAKSMRAAGAAELPQDVTHLSWFQVRDANTEYDYFTKFLPKELAQEVVGQDASKAGMEGEIADNISEFFKKRAGFLVDNAQKRVGMQMRALQQALPRQVGLYEPNTSVDSYRVLIGGASTNPMGYGTQPGQTATIPIPAITGTHKTGNSLQLNRAGFFDNSDWLKLTSGQRILPDDGVNKKLLQEILNTDESDLGRVLSNDKGLAKAFDNFAKIRRGMNEADVNSISSKLARINKFNAREGLPLIQPPTVTPVPSAQDIINGARNSLYNDMYNAVNSGNGFATLMERTPVMSLKFNSGGFLANPFAGGGDIHIKPSHRGRLTELKERTGKSEAELYNDGNPAHKKMVVFARNARKWNHHADGGALNTFPSGGKFITTLSPEREEAFQRDWQRYALQYGQAMNPDAPEHYYDYRGFWNENKRGNDLNPFMLEASRHEGHLPDKYKTPGHPTFSVESIYAKDAPGLAGTWENGIYVPPVMVDQDAIKLRQRYAESAFNDLAQSPAGALGAYQIMPATAQEYARRMGESGNLLDAAYNERMRDYIWKDFYNSELASKGNPLDTVRTAKALAMYNWGRGNLATYLNKQKENGSDIYGSLDWVNGLPKETRDYINFILLNKDVPDTSKTQAAYEKAAQKYGYSIGGRIDRQKISKAYGMLMKSCGGNIQRMSQKLSYLGKK